MRQPKLVFSNFDPVTLVSVVTIDTIYGRFTASTIVHEDDELNIKNPSRFAGCEYAESKAYCKFYKAHIRALKERKKALENLEKILKGMKGYNPYNFETRKLRRSIYELNEEIEHYKSLIVATKETMVKAMIEREEYLKNQSN